jgi:hypothetical protein
MLCTNTFVNKIIVFLDIIQLSVFYLNERFGHWIQSPSSGKGLLGWARSIELVPISGLE